MSDYHLHLHPHGPYGGLGPPPGQYPAGHIESYVEAAQARGVHELCFTEHLYRCVEAEGVLGRFWESDPKEHLAAVTERFIREDRTLSLEGYVEAIESAKGRGLPVLLGLEVDFVPGTIEGVLELLDPYPWDLLIGSVHWLGGWQYDHPESMGEFEERGVRQAYEDYFAQEAELARSGAVDVLAHVDYIKALGHRLEEPPLDLYREVVSGAVASGTAVEINSSGLNPLTAEIFPAPLLLGMFHQAGVGITLGSDAHYPDGAGGGLDEAKELARSVGYTTRLEFRRRVGREVPL